MGRCLYQARTALRLSQRELGERLGVTAHTVMRWENGRFAPPKRARPALLAALADAGAPLVDALGIALGMEGHIAARKAALEEALREAVEIADAKPSALRAALKHVMDRAVMHGVSFAELRARVAPVKADLR